MCFFFILFSLLLQILRSLFIQKFSAAFIHPFGPDLEKHLLLFIYSVFFCLFVATIQRWKRVPYIHKCIQHTTHSVRATDDSCVALSPNSTNKNNNKIHSHPFISLLHYFFYPIILFVSAIFILGYFFFFSSLRGIDIVRE